MTALVPRALLALLLLAFAFVPEARAQSDRRVALVIGNGAYVHAGALRNPPRDARRMAEVLRTAGFDVILGVDLDRGGMEGRIREFGDRLQGARLGLFFYAGHGVQVAGENHLLPVGARLQREADLGFEAVPLGQVLRTMEGAAPTNLVFLDACRDNPLTRSLASGMGTRSAMVGQGLAQVQSAVGTLVSFATAPNSVAWDGDGENSPFTSALSRHLTEPGVEVGLAMRRVRESVLNATRRQQVPWDHSSLTGEVVLVPAAMPVPAPAPAPVATPAPAAPPTGDRELVFWQSAVAGGTRADFEAYLQVYPNGAFAPLARLRLAAPVAPAATPTPPVTPAPTPAPAPAMASRVVPSPTPTPAPAPVAPAAFARPGLPPADALAAIGRAGWSVDGTTGCWLWNTQTNPLAAGRWTGACPGGPGGGSGTLEWRWTENGQARLQRWVGSLENGRPTGRGTASYPDDSRYDGEMRGGLRNGRGLYVWANGSRYDGDFRDGLRTGRGTYAWPNGARYEGDFRDGVRVGRGTYVWASGDRYEGDFADNRMHGRGTYVWTTGVRYDGEWQNDLKSGQGVQTWPTGARYTGTYRNDRANGYGEYVTAGGVWYRGNWVNGCHRDGRGRWAAVGATEAECRNGPAT